MTFLCEKGCGLMIKKRFLLDHNCYLALQTQLSENLAKSTAVNIELLNVSESLEEEKKKNEHQAVLIAKLETCNASLPEELVSQFCEL